MIYVRILNALETILQVQLQIFVAIFTPALHFFIFLWHSCTKIENLIFIKIKKIFSFILCGAGLLKYFTTNSDDRPTMSNKSEYR